jgi:hypothetical protein
VGDFESAAERLGSSLGEIECSSLGEFECAGETLLSLFGESEGSSL